MLPVMNRPIFALLCLLASAVAAPPIIRDPGVIYLSDFSIKPLRLKVLEPAHTYFDIEQSRYAGTLRFPQIVQAEAFADNGLLRVRGNAQQGGIVAWVPPEFLEPLPENFLANLKKSEERRRTVEALIEQNEVAIGMTVEEVARSLGRPQKKTKRANSSETQQVWEYVKYNLVPQTTYVPVNPRPIIPFFPPNRRPGPPGPPCPPDGNLVQNTPGFVASTIYIKVPVGTITLTFKNNLVESIEQSEGTTTGGQVSVVIPPINVYW